MRRRPDERGAAAVEFALVAPLLFLILFGIISYGYMLSYRQSLSQGAAEAARAAAVLPASSTSAQKVAAAVTSLNNSLQSYGVSCSISGAATSGSLLRGTTTVGSCAVGVYDCSSVSSATPSQTTAVPDCISVNVNHLYAANPLIPSFPGVGAVLPPKLGYTAVAGVS
ncbi:pilus assembly protein [Nocardioides sp. TRM66260-LWL]|uniref:TadE/TadG family type IV pilus assembly protein n=1 Tax=Nocardioides sp. TRM66260-LWL TaxID=2874478 RepID=UPI001CC5DBD6|nr:TadE/TadG family type IV pilus assembly protein [Nocardioides sp. TRM66260-LWL]MBZ5733172.1 pilus assembly protein [Nocardioides sp. TRM66260-LWL]